MSWEGSIPTPNGVWILKLIPKMEIPFLVKRNGGIEIIFITSCDLLLWVFIIACGTQLPFYFYLASKHTTMNRTQAIFTSQPRPHNSNHKN